MSMDGHSLEAAPCAVIVTDAHGGVETLDPAAEQLTGWSADDARGRLLTEVCHLISAKTRDALEDIVGRVLRDGAIDGFEESTLLVRRDGTERPVVGSASSVRGGEGREAGVIVVLRDASEQGRMSDLEATRRMLESTGRIARVGGWEHDLETREATWTDTLYDLIELERGTRPPGVDEHWDYYPPEDRAKLREVYERAISDGTPFDLELQVSTATGRLIWCRVYGECVFEDGQCVRLRGAFQDISARKAAEGELRQSRGMLERVFDVLPVGLWFADKDGTLLRGNPAGVRIWGAEPLVPPSEYGVFKARRFPSGEEIGPEDWSLVPTIRDGETVVDELLEIDAFDGVTRIILNYTAPLLSDEGEVEGAVIVNQDITERERARQSEREAERRWRQYVEHAPYGVFITDEHGRYLEVNPAASRITGYSEEELLSQGIPDIIVDEDRELAVRSFRTVQETGETRDALRYVHKSGEKRWWLVSAVRLSDTRFMGFVADIHERKLAEEERERLKDQLAQSAKMESVGRLAGGIAHDFNNMLQVILGNCELALAKLTGDDRLRDRLLEIHDAAESSANLTRQLLTFARQQPVAPCALDLNETVGGTLKMLQRLLGEDVELSWLPLAGAWPVFIDPVQVEQILANLAVNARDATPGSCTITITTGNVTLDEAAVQRHPGAAPGDYVGLSVKDNGQGMDEETLGKIFDPFFTTKQLGHGTGLGLATVYGITSQNRGFVEVASEVGVGTTFHVYLPRHHGDVEGEDATKVGLPRSQGETILLVEDEVSILHVCTSILTRLGYHVVPASAPAEAIELASQHPDQISLLLTDVVMPEMNGRELAELLESQHPGIKTVYMSGYTADVIAERGILESGVQFIQKPFVIQSLAAKLRQVLDG